MAKAPHTHGERDEHQRNPVPLLTTPHKGAAVPLGIAPEDVSIVIPAYNAACTLAETLESVFAQSAPVREIIVVNDGSKDDTASVLARYQPRVRVIDQPNGGLASARNTGCIAAMGKFIAILDADDLASPDRVALQVACLRLNPDIVLCYSDFSAFGDGMPRSPSYSQTYYSTFSDHKSPFPPRQIYHSSDGEQVTLHVADHYEWLAHGNIVHPPTMMFRRTLFETAGPFDESICNMCDWEWIVRASRCGLFGYIERPLLDYRMHQGQMHRDARAALDTLQVTKLICQRDPELARRHRRRFRKEMAMRYIEAANALCEINKLEAWRNLLKAMKLGRTSALVPRIVAKSLLPQALVKKARSWKSGLMPGV